MISSRLMRTVPDKGIRQATLVLLNLLMRTADLDQAATIYKKLHILLGTRYDNDTVRQTFHDVISYINRTVPDNDDLTSPADVEDVVVTDPDEDCDNSMEHESAATIKQQSPFTRYFVDSLGVLADSDDVGGGKRNKMYSPAAFKVIADVMHLYPLWAAALHDNVDRFAVDVTDDVRNVEPPRCRSNAILESHFKSVKHGHKNSRKLRPRLFVTERLRSVLAMVNQAAIRFPDTRKRHRPTVNDDPSSVPEIWKRKKRGRRYGDKNVSLKILQKINATPSQQSKKVFNFFVSVIVYFLLVN